VRRYHRVPAKLLEVHPEVFGHTLSFLKTGNREVAQASAFEAAGCTPIGACAEAKGRAASVAAGPENQDISGAEVF
jgi:hypothetical protein